MCSQKQADEHPAERGEVIVEADTISRLGEQVMVAEWREDAETDERF